MKSKPKIANKKGLMSVDYLSKMSDVRQKALFKKSYIFIIG